MCPTRFLWVPVCLGIAAAGLRAGQPGAESWKATATIAADEAVQAAAADEGHLYAIANSVVAKYDRATGKRIAQSTGEAEHLNSGFFWQGRLYCAHSNYPATPPRSDIRVLDPRTMQLSVHHRFSGIDGSLTWVIRDGRGQWWANFAHYGEDNHKTILVELDERLREQARWRYPAELIEKLGNYSLSGGIWRDGELLVTGHDARALYRLRLPAGGGDTLKLAGAAPAPFTGQGIAADPRGGGLVGIDRAARRLVLATPVPPRSADEPTAAEPIRDAGDDGGDSVRLRVLSYNIHHGEGVDGRLDLERISRTITSVEPDLVALQEVDRRTARTDRVDQPAELSERTGMRVAFGGNIDHQGGRYGNAVLSRYPILRHRNHLLPSLGGGEQRGVLEVEIEVPAMERPLLLLATHLDHRRDDRERRVSAAAINRLVADRSDQPALLAGDLNDTPESATLERLAAQWRRAGDRPLPTVPVDVPTRQIDFVLIRPRNSWRVVDVRVLDAPVASDHRPILAVLEWSPSGS